MKDWGMVNGCVNDKKAQGRVEIKRGREDTHREAGLFKLMRY